MELVNHCFDTRYADIISSHSGLYPGEAFHRWFFFRLNLIWSGSFISKLDSGLQSLVGFRILIAGFRIPKPRIPDSRIKKFLDSGIRIPLHGAIQQCQIKQQLGLGSLTAVDWDMFCRELCKVMLFEKREELGGPGKIVEIDESKIGNRKKISPGTCCQRTVGIWTN